LKGVKSWSAQNFRLSMSLSNGIILIRSFLRLHRISFTFQKPAKRSIFARIKFFHSYLPIETRRLLLKTCFARRRRKIPFFIRGETFFSALVSQSSRELRCDTVKILPIWIWSSALAYLKIYGRVLWGSFQRDTKAFKAMKSGFSWQKIS
jgi:hypothetical protein